MIPKRKDLANEIDEAEMILEMERIINQKNWKLLRPERVKKILADLEIELDGKIKQFKFQRRCEMFASNEENIEALKILMGKLKENGYDLKLEEGQGREGYHNGQDFYPTATLKVSW